MNRFKLIPIGMVAFLHFVLSVITADKVKTLEENVKVLQELVKQYDMDFAFDKCDKDSEIK